MSSAHRAASNASRECRSLTALLVSIALLLPSAAGQVAAYGAGRAGNTASQSDTLSGTVQATTENSPGLRQTKFSAPQGTIGVNLPDDLAAGDSLTGTVAIQPAGNNDEERARNRAALEKLSVNVDGQIRSAAEEMFKLAIPADGSKKAVEVALQDTKGKELSRLDAPVSPDPPRSAPADFELPTLVQQGRFAVVRGPFNGDIADTDHVKLGGQPMKQAVESPRAMVFANASRAVGATPLVLKEQERVVTAEVQNVAVSLTAERLNLQKGEITTLTVRVTGVGQLREVVPLHVENRSPGVVTLAGGNSQIINISPADVRPGGVYSAQRQLTGLQPGSFAITATVVPPANARSTFAQARPAAGQPAAGQPAAPPQPSPTQSTDTAAGGGSARAMIKLPARPPAFEELVRSVRSPDQIDEATTRLGMPARLLNFNLATPIDLSAVGLGKTVHIPVQISNRDGGRKSIYFLNPGEEVLAGVFVTDDGLALRYMKRLDGNNHPAQTGDMYETRVTTAHGTVVYAGRGKLEVLDPKVGLGRLVPLGRGNIGQTPPLSWVWYFWSCILDSEGKL